MDHQTDVDGLSLIDVSTEDDILLSSPALKLYNDVDRTLDFHSSPTTTLQVQQSSLDSTHHHISPPGGYFLIICLVPIFIECSFCPWRNLPVNM
jgi:hypothetical protein